MCFVDRFRDRQYEVKAMMPASFAYNCLCISQIRMTLANITVFRATAEIFIGCHTQRVTWRHTNKKKLTRRFQTFIQQEIVELTQIALLISKYKCTAKKTTKEEGTQVCSIYCTFV